MNGRRQVCNESAVPAVAGGLLAASGTEAMCVTEARLKIGCAVLGSGNIGTDLMIKVLSMSGSLDVREILVEPGRRRMVGGQEAMIVDVALDLAGQKEKLQQQAEET